MLARIALGWPLLLLRALLGLAFGSAALTMTAWPATAIVPATAGYVLGDGLLSLMLAATAFGQRAFGALLAEGLARVVVGVLALHGVTASSLVTVFAIWTLAGGAVAVALALELGSDATGEWLLPLAGAVSIACGLAPLIVRVSELDPRWLIGPYAMLFGLTLLVVALRLRQLVLEIAAAL